MHRLLNEVQPIRALAVVLVLAMAGCDRAGADCIQPPCAVPLAVEISATAAASGAPATGASFTLTGETQGQGPCPEGKCSLVGGPGTYDVDISAPGYRSVHARIVVPGTTPECGCASVAVQRVSVSLPAAA